MANLLQFVVTAKVFDDQTELPTNPELIGSRIVIPGIEVQETIDEETARVQVLAAAAANIDLGLPGAVNTGKLLLVQPDQDVQLNLNGTGFVTVLANGLFAFTGTVTSLLATNPSGIDEVEVRVWYGGLKS